MFKKGKSKDNETLSNMDNTEQLYNTYNLGQQNIDIDRNYEENFNMFQDSIKNINPLNISQKVGEYAKQQNMINEGYSQENNYVDYSNNQYVEQNNYNNVSYSQEGYDNTQYSNYNTDYNNYEQTYSNMDYTNADYNNMNYNQEYANPEEYNQEYNNMDYNNMNYTQNYSEADYNVENNYYENTVVQEEVNYEVTPELTIERNNGLYVPSQQDREMGKCQHCDTCDHKNNCEIYLNIKQKEEEMERIQREFEEKLRLERERLKALEELQAQQVEQQNVEYYSGDFNIDSAVQNKIEENQFAERYIEQNGIPQNQFTPTENVNPEDDYQHYQFRDYLSSDISLLGLAEPKERFSAHLLDSLILFVLYGLTYLLMLHDSFMNLIDMIMLNNSNVYNYAMLSPYVSRFISFFCVTIIIKVVYSIIIPLYLYKGKTIGKKIKNIQIKPANEDILDLDFSMLFKRELVGKFIGGLFFGYLRMYKKEDKKCYHDIYAGTKVIKD